ncbi:hypothetical protein GLOIN_2v1843995 [Rhizophagus irregularis DAOM 181602=DAOM 197198]|uniref:Uncharacterized protein n=1 Tax=Rhizophagus irregularis (strain DAOM 181602 / DAOM 197198 / MUCL 43194) TaxID=747089 RepID=A0A2P4PMS5_RHIID|nr:hypothetical protein GLOIN_2v1843995 [Rhizophagus irregularis DAOM 181602=DAOM 197198]POG66686.1 hypothetical protein GLOIN_2v1843995 [Rhizophagus irregularis DAOM 181602=DAOM 197198]|eukprot:XP_025173552.1 hypothetical protein GLOIN_2v1843995 [Rhizophagus irregularis DAOM 181602=DAOM 197198]
MLTQDDLDDEIIEDEEEGTEETECEQTDISVALALAINNINYCMWQDNCRFSKKNSNHTLKIENHFSEKLQGFVGIYSTIILGYLMFYIQIFKNIKDYLKALQIILAINKKTKHLKNQVAPIVADWPG